MERLSYNEFEEYEPHKEVELHARQQSVGTGSRWVREASSLSVKQRNHTERIEDFLMTMAEKAKRVSLALLSRFQGLGSTDGSIRARADFLQFGTLLLILLGIIACVLVVLYTILLFCGMVDAAWERKDVVPRQPLVRSPSPIQSAAQPVGYSQSNTNLSSVAQSNSSVYWGHVSPPQAHRAMSPAQRPVHLSPQPYERAATRLPPALYPSTGPPIHETCFGVPMSKIAQLSTHGELRIVGLSGKPLFCASIRKDGSQHSLTISLIEAGSAPCATIGPNLQDLNRSGDGKLEIRGPNGYFYGFLQMRASGACDVNKDGETVMVIDVEYDSLQLSIKSCGGVPFAFVRISAEEFGGVEHVEIRIERGVDTLLVLSCVLAVLLSRLMYASA